MKIKRIFFFIIVLLLFLGGCEGCEKDWSWITGPSGGGKIPLGMSIHACEDPAYLNNSEWDINKLLRYSQMIGATAIRTSVYTDRPGSLSCVAELSRLAPRYGITTVLVVITAHGGRSGLDNWEAEVRKVVNGTNATHIQILNEIDNFFKGMSPLEYTRTYLPKAAAIIRAGGKKVVSASPTGGHDGLLWLKALLDEGMDKYVDVIGIHSYELGPNRFVEELRRRRINKPVWLTEVGNPSPANHIRTYQALSYIRGIEKVFWYALYDGNDSGFGLLRHEGKGKFVVNSPLFNHLAEKN